MINNLNFSKRELELIKDVINNSRYKKLPIKDEIFDLYNKLDNAGVEDVDFGIDKLWDDYYEIKDILIDVGKKIKKLK